MIPCNPLRRCRREWTSLPRWPSPQIGRAWRQRPRACTCHSPSPSRSRCWRLTDIDCIGNLIFTIDEKLDKALPVITTTFPSSLAGLSDPFMGETLKPSIIVNVIPGFTCRLNWCVNVVMAQSYQLSGAGETIDNGGRISALGSGVAGSGREGLSWEGSVHGSAHLRIGVANGSHAPSRDASLLSPIAFHFIIGFNENIAFIRQNPSIWSICFL